MVEVELTQQLHLLDADRGEHRDRAHAPRRQVRHRERDAAAHAEPDDMDVVDPQRVEQLEHVPGVRPEGVVGDLPLRCAEARKVRHDHAIALRQVRNDGLEVVLTARAAVKEDDDGRAGNLVGARAGIGEPDRAFEDPVSVDRRNLRNRILRSGGRRARARMADDARDGDQNQIDCPEHAGNFSHGAHGTGV
jgi:hypothetical protein